MTVSIIICTRNRARSLKETLDSIAGVTLSQGVAVELLVVDNGSSDETHNIVREARMPQLMLRYLYEARGGQCYARNAGLQEAAGEIMIFTDDDVRVPADWVGAMSQPIKEKGAMLVQGGITPASHLTRSWMPMSFLAVSATVALPALPIPPLQSIGANMAFHRSVFEKVRGFDPVFGPGSHGGFCDDILFGAMAREAGFTASYAQCSIEHHFDPCRLDPSNVLDVARRLGRSYALLDFHWRHDDSNVAPVRGMLVKAKLAIRRQIAPKRPDRVAEWEYWYERELAYQTQMTELAGTERRYARRAITARVD